MKRGSCQSKASGLLVVVLHFLEVGVHHVVFAGLAARVMLRPASEGTGVIAGGAVRVVLELAGVKNAFGKQLGSGNPLNNARAAVEGLRLQRTVEMVAKERGLTVAQMLQHKPA